MSRSAVTALASRSCSVSSRERPDHAADPFFPPRTGARPWQASCLDAGRQRVARRPCISLPREGSAPAVLPGRFVPDALQDADVTLCGRPRVVGWRQAATPSPAPLCPSGKRRARSTPGAFLCPTAAPCCALVVPGSDARPGWHPGRPPWPAARGYMRTDPRAKASRRRRSSYSFCSSNSVSHPRSSVRARRSRSARTMRAIRSGFTVTPSLNSTGGDGRVPRSPTPREARERRSPVAAAVDVVPHRARLRAHACDAQVAPRLSGSGLSVPRRPVPVWPVWGARTPRWAMVSPSPAL